MDDQDPTQAEKQQAAMLAIHTQQRLSRLVAGTLGQMAGIVLQLRSHERWMEHHDDVTKHIGSDLIESVVATYGGFIEGLDRFESQMEETRNDDESTAVMSRFRVALERYPYLDRLDGIGARYLGAFQNDPLARFILTNLGELLGSTITESIPAMIGLLQGSMAARRVGIIELDGTIVGCLRDAHHDGMERVAREAVAELFERACPELDRTAIMETRRFNYLVAEGSQPSQAAQMTRERFQDRVARILERCRDEPDS